MRKSVGMNMSSSSEDEDDSPPRRRAQHRMRNEHVERAFSEKPCGTLSTRKGQSTQAGQWSRIEAVERMSQSLQQRHGEAARERFSSQHQRARRGAQSVDSCSGGVPSAAPVGLPMRACGGGVPSAAPVGLSTRALGGGVPSAAPVRLYTRAATVAWPEPALHGPEAEAVASCGLGVTHHMQSILNEAKTESETSPELGAALEAALEAAIQSLTACQAQQSQVLQREVARLKAEFRQKLAELEADFVLRAEALSSELSSSVAEQKGECELQVAEHAEHLTNSIRSLRHEPSYQNQTSRFRHGFMKAYGSGTAEPRSLQTPSNFGQNERQPAGMRYRIGSR
ncbi:hypothetical protein AB1Y20_006651 [Prymnesium parvum]|uniref:Uncharacterized protein n=1 Tax=Prymnesium parvum TaxID=97485 RepID=A0AB34J1D7_PRYPA